jgi:hypothetical protein
MPFHYVVSVNTGRAGTDITLDSYWPPAGEILTGVVHTMSLLQQNKRQEINKVIKYADSDTN